MLAAEKQGQDSKVQVFGLKNVFDGPQINFAEKKETSTTRQLASGMSVTTDISFWEAGGPDPQVQQPISHFLWPNYDKRELHVPRALQDLGLLEKQEAEHLNRLRQAIWGLEAKEEI